MLDAIPDPVRRADAELHSIFEQYRFFEYLNPQNPSLAHHAFLQGAEAPPFVYQPLTHADDLLRRLDAADPPRDHPAGALVGDLFDGTRLLVRALRDRDPATFDEMARSAGWYPDAELLALRFPSTDLEDQPLVVSAQAIAFRLEVALRARGMNAWRVETSDAMAARVLVQGAQKRVVVNPQARFRRRDLVRLVVHEIDIHATRAENGSAQPLRCFETGLPDSLATEEGLAMVAEERAGVASPAVLQRQAEVVRAIDEGRRMGFRDLYTRLVERVGPALAWGICLRIKRGLADPSLPGVYAKDSAYLRGRMLVADWLERGGDPRWLFVGKVGVHDPVEEWVRQGWVKIEPVPGSWNGAAS